MPVDPQIQALLDLGTGVPATNTLSVSEARAQYEGRIRLMAPAPDVGVITERSIAPPPLVIPLRIVPSYQPRRCEPGHSVVLGVGWPALTQRSPLVRSRKWAYTPAEF